MASKEQVRDGFLYDLPEDIQSKVMAIHRLLVNKCNETLKNNVFSSISNSSWSKSMLDEFLTTPRTNSHVGSVRVYKKGNRYSCMIQLSGHVNNNRNDLDHELFHDMIRNVHSKLKPKIRREYNMALTCESEHGELFEGLDLWTSSKVAKSIWESFDKMKTKSISHMKESVEEKQNVLVTFAEMDELPLGLQNFIHNTKSSIYESINRIVSNNNKLLHFMESCRYEHNEGYTLLRRNSNGSYFGEIVVTPELIYEYNSEDFNDVAYSILESKYEDIVRLDSTKELALQENSNSMYYKFRLTNSYSKKLYEYLENNQVEFIEESYDNEKDGLYKKDPKSYISNAEAKGNARGVAVDNEFSSKKHYADSTKGGQSISWLESYVLGRIRKTFKTRESVTRVTTSDVSDICRMSYRFINGRYDIDYDKVEELISKLEKAINKEIQETRRTGKKKNLHINHFDKYGESTYYSFDESTSESESKKTLRSVSQNIIDEMNNKSNYKVSQYTANIYANIISKDLLPIWAKGFRKLSITVDTKNQNTFEFKIPHMTQDFAGRFIEGRETLNGFIRRQPEIKIKIGTSIFNTMESPDDAYNFFKSAVRYYDSQLDSNANKILHGINKIPPEMKRLITTTKLSGLVSLPIQLLFVFDNIKMNEKNPFKINGSDIKKINEFINKVYTSYASPEKEKAKILDDLNKVLISLKESMEFDSNIKDINYLYEEVKKLYNGYFDNEIGIIKNKWICEQVDKLWEIDQDNYQIKYIQEAFGVKKLKKIPADLVAYITIEGESIRDANDKMMIASYCVSKIEIVEWYIELLDTNNRRYVVPHTRPYLQSLRTSLLQCYKNIMAVKIDNNKIKGQPNLEDV